MKSLVSCLLLLPLVTSCNEYYGSGYYAPAPGVEVEHYQSHHYHQAPAYRYHEEGPVYHGHGNRQMAMVEHGPHRHPREQAIEAEVYR